MFRNKAAWRRREVDARLFDELRDRRDPSPGAPSISAEVASTTKHASAGGAKSAQTSAAAKIAAGGTHPTCRPQTFAKLVALRLAKLVRYFLVYDS
jgi:hypothetical protein